MLVVDGTDGQRRGTRRSAPGPLEPRLGRQRGSSGGGYAPRQWTAIDEWCFLQHDREGQVGGTIRAWRLMEVVVGAKDQWMKGIGLGDWWWVGAVRLSAKTMESGGGWVVVRVERWYGGKEVDRGRRIARVKAVWVEQSQSWWGSVLAFFTAFFSFSFFLWSIAPLVPLFFLFSPELFEPTTNTGTRYAVSVDGRRGNGNYTQYVQIVRWRRGMEEEGGRVERAEDKAGQDKGLGANW